MVQKMYDLDSIIQQHNYYALESMMRTLRTEVVQSPQPENWSLSVLVEKLRTGPPVLSELLSAFTGVEVMSGFLELIMRYLPEYEMDILSKKGGARLYRFCELFQRRYFPLVPGAYDQSIEAFIRSMPIGLLGMSYTAYHELGMRPGYTLLLSLLPYPYEGDERDERDDRVPFDPNNLAPSAKWNPTAADRQWLRGLVDSLAIGGEWIAPMGFAVVKQAYDTIELREAKDTPGVKETIRRTLLIAERLGIKTICKAGKTSKQKIHGARVALLDAVRQIAGDRPLKLIPASGWDRQHVHRMTDGTVYDGAGAFADWAFAETGCILLDHNYENCIWSFEGQDQAYFSWSEYNIKVLTKQWPEVRQTREKIDNLVEFIEGDPSARFNELVEILSSQKPVGKRKVKSLTFMDRLEEGIPLQQADLSEDEEEGEYDDQN